MFQLVFLGLMKVDVYCEFPYEICHVSTNIKIIIHVDYKLDTGYFSQYT